jgi:L-2-hydroxyglutarate oxidase LhgO
VPSFGDTIIFNDLKAEISNKISAPASKWWHSETVGTPVIFIEDRVGTDFVDCAVIGAGVVGLAVASALARSGRDVVIIEREAVFGSGTSSRNSEVIHAGIYYPPGSLKARLCIAGKQKLYEFCRRRAVEHKNCGKLIVATSEAQVAELEAIKRRAESCGVEDLSLRSAAEILAMEPALNCVAGLVSPSTGIIDSHGYMLSLLGEAEEHGAVIAYDTAISRIEPTGDGALLFINDEEQPSLRAGLLVNSAGLDAVALARSMTGFPREHIPPAYFAKGNYFTLSGKSPFSRLIYPVPEPGGLGVHLTLDLAGQARFGPDVEWIDAPAYDVDPKRGDKFYAAIRRYWPGLRDGALEPGYAGVRPKLSAPGEPAADFVIAGRQTHGVAGIINLFGIESPGLTASLAIADEVLRLAEEG